MYSYTAIIKWVLLSLNDNIFSAEVVAGTTVIVQPSFSSKLRIFFLQPSDLVGPVFDWTL